MLLHLFKYNPVFLQRNYVKIILMAPLRCFNNFCMFLYKFVHIYFIQTLRILPCNKISQMSSPSSDRCYTMHYFVWCIPGRFLSTFVHHLKFSTRVQHKVNLVVFKEPAAKTVVYHEEEQ